MEFAESQYLLELWQMNICPQCGKRIPEGTRVGSGQKTDGGFCSLNCYAKFHELELIERAESLRQMMKRIRNN
jgi:hypothetical protein